MGGAAAPAAPPGWLDRLLAIAADEDAEAAGARLRVLRRFLLAWGASRTWVWIAFGSTMERRLIVATAIALTASAGLAFVRRLEHAATWVALAALAVQAVASFPLAHNHFFVELLAVAILALAGPGGCDAPLALAGLRWLTAIALFHTGLQKLLYGHYLHGDFLAFMIGRGERFARLFRSLVPRGDVARLRAYDPFQDGAGPFRVDAPALVAASNAVWIAEVVLPVGLMVRRTRTLAGWAAVALVAAIQVGAWEMGFAILFVNLLALFLSPAVARRMLWPFLLLMAWMVAASWGFVPGRGPVAAWHLW